jgi:very-short-patch-repair endonuclease
MLTGPAQTVRAARRLRKEMTLPEVILWTELRKRPGGLKFRNQHPAGRYVVDFFCASAKLAVEIDGEVHGRGDQPEKDRVRDAWLNREGVRVVRVPAKAVLDDVAAVIDHVVARISPDQPLHRSTSGPPPRSGEELSGDTECP